MNLLYTHFRPLGKALLTISLPEYTQPAIREIEDLNVAGSRVFGEPIYNVESTRVIGKAMLGNGPSAGLEAGKTVTMSGFPGRISITNIYKLLKDFDVNKITAVPM